MPPHPKFPDDPHVIMHPAERRFPGDESPPDRRFDHLMPPPASNLRKEAKKRREREYEMTNPSASFPRGA